MKQLPNKSLSPLAGEGRRALRRCRHFQVAEAITVWTESAPSPYPASSSEYPAERTVRTMSAWESSLSALRRRRIWTSTVRGST